MFFFALVGIVTLAAAALGRLGVPGLQTWPARMRWGLSVGLLLAGIDHLVTPARYVPMIESFLPMAREFVLFTGVCEIAGAIGLLMPRTRWLAAVMLAIYFVCVFPANVHNAVSGLSVDGLPDARWIYWVRLLFQPLIIWWALFAGEVLATGRRVAAVS